MAPLSKNEQRMVLEAIEESMKDLGFVCALLRAHDLGQWAYASDCFARLSVLFVHAEDGTLDKSNV
jgi:hypothetical protein